jgi:ParB family chromosome partitioning protein
MSQIVKLENSIKLPISKIVIDDRVRVDMGDIENLAISMQIHGLLSPIIVSQHVGDTYILLEGERRILAARSLGWTTIECTLVEQLPEIRRKEIELIMCVQRKQLSYIEEARAVRDLVERRKKEGVIGGLAKFGGTVRNKDVAMELNMTEARLSENLRIATMVDDHPELEAECISRSEFLKRIRKRDYYVPMGGILQSIYEQNFIVASPLACLDSIQDKIIDLAILHPDIVDVDLLDAVLAKLKMAGQIIIFCTHANLRAWEDVLKERKLRIGEKPYMWNVKGESDYISYIWAGKNMSGPLRPIPQMLSAARPSGALDGKAKPMILLNHIIKGCTERGGFVVCPDCKDIETVRCCIEITRNVRAACINKVMRDQLIMNVVRGVGEDRSI